MKIKTIIDHRTEAQLFMSAIKRCTLRDLVTFICTIAMSSFLIFLHPLFVVLIIVLLLLQSLYFSKRWEQEKELSHGLREAIQKLASFKKPRFS